MGELMDMEQKDRLVGPQRFQNRFFEGIRSGFTKEAAAAQAGFSRRSLYLWQQKGQVALERQERGETLSDRDLVYADFVLGFEFAWDLGEANLHDRANTLAENGKSTWTQPVTVLERTRREKWGKRSDGEIIGRVEIVIEGRPPREPAEVAVLEATAALTEG